MIERNPAWWYIARKFENTGINIDDLVSIGTIGLIKAVNTFDPHKNIKLATYASKCIENEILMFLRRNNRVKAEVSFDEPLNVDWDGNELLLSDVLGTEGDLVLKNIEEEVERKLLYLAMEKLGTRERRIMELRFGLATVMKPRRSKWRNCWGYPSLIYPDWKKNYQAFKKEIRRLNRFMKFHNRIKLMAMKYFNYFPAQENWP